MSGTDLASIAMPAASCPAAFISGRERFRFVLAAPGDDDRRAAGREAPGDGRADAAVAAWDVGGFVAEVVEGLDVEGHFFFSS